jgi:hydroxymethylpyrimidine/phosphomethylpyrimidine kinase
MTAQAALTAQNSLGVRRIHEVPSDFVGAQIDAVVEDIGVDVVKTGIPLIQTTRFKHELSVSRNACFGKYNLCCGRCVAKA